MSTSVATELGASMKISKTVPKILFITGKFYSAFNLLYGCGTKPIDLLYNYEMMGIPFQIKPFDPFGCLSPKILLNRFSNSEFYKKF